MARRTGRLGILAMVAAMATVAAVFPGAEPAHAITVMPQIMRDAGTYQAKNIGVAGLVRPDTDYIVTALMDPADLADPTIIIHYTLTLDGVVVRDEDWHLPIIDRGGQIVAPTVDYSTGAFEPSSVTLTFGIPKRMRFGADLTLGSILR